MKNKDNESSRDVLLKKARLLAKELNKVHVELARDHNVTVDYDLYTAITGPGGAQAPRFEMRYTIVKVEKL
jgi:hypothetical protein